ITRQESTALTYANVLISLVNEFSVARPRLRSSRAALLRALYCGPSLQRRPDSLSPLRARSLPEKAHAGRGGPLRAAVDGVWPQCRGAPLHAGGDSGTAGAVACAGGADPGCMALVFRLCYNAQRR